MATDEDALALYQQLQGKGLVELTDTDWDLIEAYLGYQFQCFADKDIDLQIAINSVTHILRLLNVGAIEGIREYLNYPKVLPDRSSRIAQIRRMQFALIACSKG